MVTTAVSSRRAHEVLRPARGNTTCGWLPGGFYAEVDLKSDAHVVHARVPEDSRAFEFRILRDFLGGHSIIEEGQAAG
jgi:hypothetical protein